MEEKKLSVVIVCKREVMARTRMGRERKKLINYIFLSLVLFHSYNRKYLDFFFGGVEKTTMVIMTVLHVKLSQ